jgi:hypothetical protein
MNILSLFDGMSCGQIALNKLGVNYDNYYAADIGWDSNRKEYFIFEFNSAPGLNENTAKVYAEFLAERI